MLTRNNFRNFVLSLNDKDKRRILNSNKEYTIIITSICNAGYWWNIKLTNRYRNFKDYTKSIVYTKEIQNILMEC